MDNQKNVRYCPDFIPEEHNPYPLCDNPDCKDKETCNMSLHMNEEPYWGDE